jgi:hypothetical protein
MAACSSSRSNEAFSRKLTSAFTDLRERLAESLSCSNSDPSKRMLIGTGSLNKSLAVVAAMTISPCRYTDGHINHRIMCPQACAELHAELPCCAPNCLNGLLI